MAKRIAFLARPTRIIQVLLAAMCLLAPGEAQHGGGGGHSAGGHVGGGHSSGSHTGGGRTGGSHSGWLRLGFGNRAARRAGLGTVGTPDTSRHLPPDLVKGATPVRAASLVSIQPAPPRSLRFPVFFAPRFVGSSFFFSSRFRHRPSSFFGRFPCFRASGCFFNGLTQVCFFEPALPLFFFSSGFDSFLSGAGFSGDSLGIGDDLNSLGTMQQEIAVEPPTPGPMDADTSAPAGENSPTNGGARVDAATEAADEAAGKDSFLLVLKNGTSHAATNYWLADGYLEYVGPDRTRSHVPLEALDLQKTVVENSRRGLPFVLRSAP
jgi:hypothetical protein